MAYTQFDKILVDHYNTFVSGAPAFGVTNHAIANLNTVWGEGNNDKGYGQTTTLSQATIGSIITATQWQTLFDRVLSAADHQGSALGAQPETGIDPVTGGDLITAIVAFQSNIDDIFANRLVATTTGVTQIENTSAAGNWSATSTHTINVTFASGNAARYFFNAGGYISITGSASGGTPAKVDPWDDGVGAGILPETNEVRFNAQSTTKVGGSGVLSSDYFIEATTGYYGIGLAPIEVFKQFTLGGGAYPTNHITVEVSTNGPVGGAGDNGNILTFIVTLNDDVGAGDPVDGTMNIDLTATFPDTTFLTETPWGAVTFVPASGVVQV